MKIAIVGSRNYRNLEAVREYVLALPDDTVIISGGARGVDTVAEMTATFRGLKTEIYLPQTANFPSFGAAAVARNEQIVLAADRVVAFHDGKSPGTAHTIRFAKKHNKPLEIIGGGA